MQTQVISSQAVPAGQAGRIMPKGLFWRGDVLWARVNLPGHPERFSLGIRTTGSPSDRKRCEREGEAAIASLRTKFIEGRFFEIQKPEEPYNPKFWRVAGRYLTKRLLKTKTGRDMKYHLAASLRKFGKRYAKEITREEVEKWLESQKREGVAVNTINNRFTCLRAAFRYANQEQDRHRLGYDPTEGVSKLPGGNVRRFLLTKEKFERNYTHLKGYNPRFALFYLALWETGRRPMEVSQYTWEMVEEVEIDGQKVSFLSVPPEICKMQEYDVVALSPRLLQEMQQLGYRHGFIFRNSIGERWQYWEHHQQQLEKAFGKDAGVIRDCRRGFVTLKTEVEGHDPFHVRKATGHKTNAVFERYRIGSLRNLVAVVGAGKSTKTAQFLTDERKNASN